LQHSVHTHIQQRAGVLNILYASMTRSASLYCPSELGERPFAG